jgi:RimJ/RimL family protein N-acetyltransferase
MLIHIETERLVLRELREDDWKAIWAYRSHPNVSINIAPSQRTEEGTRKNVQDGIAAARTSPRRTFDLAIELKENGAVIGTLAYYQYPYRGIFLGGIGYDLAKPYWGRGLMTEACRELIAFGFDHLEVNGLYTSCYSRNSASIRVLEKVGMERRRISWFGNLRLACHYREWTRYRAFYLSADRWRSNTDRTLQEGERKDR